MTDCISAYPAYKKALHYIKNALRAARIKTGYFCGQRSYPVYFYPPEDLCRWKKNFTFEVSPAAKF